MQVVALHWNACLKVSVTAWIRLQTLVKIFISTVVAVGTVEILFQLVQPRLVDLGRLTRGISNHCVMQLRVAGMVTYVLYSWAKQLYDSCGNTGLLNELGAQPLVELVRATGGWDLINIFNSECL